MFCNIVVISCHAAKNRHFLQFSLLLPLFIHRVGTIFPDSGKKKVMHRLCMTQVVEKLWFFDEQTSAAQSALDAEYPKPRINERIRAFFCVKSHAHVATFYEILYAPQAQEIFSSLQAEDQPRYRMTDS